MKGDFPGSITGLDGTVKNGKNSMDIEEWAMVNFSPQDGFPGDIKRGAKKAWKPLKNL